MLSFFTGRAPVSRIFWFGTILIPLVIGLALEYFMVTINTTDIPKVRMRATLALVVTSGLTTLYLVMLTQGLFKAAHWQRSPRFWGWVAIIFTALNVPASAHFTVDPWFYKRMIDVGKTRIPASEVLSQEIQTVQAALPRKLSKTMEIESAEFSRRALVFSVNAKGALHEERVAATEAAVKKILTTQVAHCAELETAFAEGLHYAIYKVRFTNSVLTARLDADQCAEILAQKPSS